MKDFKKIILLQSAEIDKTEILDVTYEAEGSVSGSDGIVYEKLPRFYRVRLCSRPGENSCIYTEVWLPKDWNSIFLGIGNGGMAGSISYGGLAKYVRQGYAVANTDLGTSRGRDSGIDNPDVWKDFGWRATHIMTVAGKALTRLLYGKKETASYFVGGSTGGQQALSEAQRFPDDYDGIVAGVPANNRTLLHTYFLWNHVHLRPKGKGPLFSSAEIRMVTDFAVQYFQAVGDGVPGDDFITFPEAGENVIAGFIAYLQKQHPEFCKEQLRALYALYTGPVNPSTGERIYNGMPIGSEINGCGIEDCQQEESPHYYPFIWAFGKDYDGYEFDFDQDLTRLNAKLAKDLNANSPDLSAFEKHGGKIILYSGSADPCVPFPDAMNYYDRIIEQMGGYEKAASFARYFLFPGKDHGNSGKGTNAIWASTEGGGELEALRLWREEGKAPDSLIAVSFYDQNPDAGIRFLRPVYPYGAPAGKKKTMTCPPACSDYYLH